VVENGVPPCFPIVSSIATGEIKVDDFWFGLIFIKKNNQTNLKRN
jgi:hypothetical protein